MIASLNFEYLIMIFLVNLSFNHLRIKEIERVRESGYDSIQVDFMELLYKMEGKEVVEKILPGDIFHSFSD